MKRKDAGEVNDDFFDFTLSSPALKIRRLDAEFAPIVAEQDASKSVQFEQSKSFQDNFVEQPMESIPIAIDEVNSSVPVNEERAIVLFNPNNNTPSIQIQSPIQFSISTGSDFLSRFKNPVIWTNGSDRPKSVADKTPKDDDGDSGIPTGCLAVVPWSPSFSQHAPVVEFEASGEQTSEMMDSDAMDVEDNCNTQQMITHHNHQWQQHCMIQQPPNNFSTPITWLGKPASSN